MNIYGDLGDYECDKCSDPCKYKDMSPPFYCSICGAEMTRRQYIETDRRIGAPLCAGCERNHDYLAKKRFRLFRSRS